MHALHSSVDRGALSQSHIIISCVEIGVWSAECFLALNFVKICLQTPNGSQKQGKSYSIPLRPKGAQNVLNLSDEVKILDLSRGSLP
jgi:hypothetical protein